MSKDKNSGFTLIEMMITVAILVILLGIAVPSFQDFIQRNRISTQTNDLVADLALARSESIKRGVKVSVCISSNGTACTAGTWADGRIVFTDAGTAATVDGTDAILRVTSAVPGGISLSSTGGAASNVQYTATGGVVSSGDFTLCKTGYKGRTVQISATGRVSSTEMAANCP